jgi:predicted ester cyclase
MGAEEHRAFAGRYMDAINHAFATGDTAALAACFAPGYVEHVREQGPDRGLGGLLAFVQAIRAAVPDARGVAEDVLVDGDRVMIRHAHYGTQQGPFMGLPPTGARLDFPGVEIFRLADGRIAESWHIDDNVRLMQQLGALPPPGAPSV